MDSIRMGSMIIRPNHGAFHELSFLDFVKTYDQYENIIQILKNHSPEHTTDNQELENFLRENSWDTFGGKLQMLLDKLLPPKTKFDLSEKKYSKPV